MDHSGAARRSAEKTPDWPAGCPLVTGWPTHSRNASGSDAGRFDDRRGCRRRESTNDRSAERRTARPLAEVARRQVHLFHMHVYDGSGRADRDMPRARRRRRDFDGRGDRATSPLSGAHVGRRSTLLGESGDSRRRPLVALVASRRASARDGRHRRVRGSGVVDRWAACGGDAVRRPTIARSTVGCVRRHRASTDGRVHRRLISLPGP